MNKAGRAGVEQIAATHRGGFRCDSLRRLGVGRGQNVLMAGSAILG